MPKSGPGNGNHKAEAGRKGGRVTLHRHGLEVCPHCHQLMPTDHYETIGRKGGHSKFLKVGTKGMSEMGKRGGRPRAE